MRPTALAAQTALGAAPVRIACSFSFGLFVPVVVGGPVLAAAAPFWLRLHRTGIIPAHHEKPTARHLETLQEMGSLPRLRFSYDWRI